MSQKEQTSNKKINYWGWEFWLHLPLIILANCSFFLFNWRLIGLGIFFLIVQYAIFGGCVLTNTQVGHKSNQSFYTIYLERFGVKLDRERFNIYIKFIHPFVVLFRIRFSQKLWLDGIMLI